MLCHCYWVSDNIVLETFVYQLRCGIHLFMHIHQSVFVSGCCCFCAIDLIDLLRKLCYSGWVSVFQLLLIVIFHRVPLSAFLNGSSFEIIGTLGVINLGGDTVAGTLGGGTVIGTLGSAIVGTYLGNTLVWVLSCCMMLNIFPIYQWRVIFPLRL